VEIDDQRISDGIAEMLSSRVEAADLTVKQVRRVFGGNARRAWSAQAAWAGKNGRQNQDLILLVRLPGAQVRTDALDEIRFLDGLAEQGVRAPRVWAHDIDGHLFDSPAVLLQRLPGSADPVKYLNADAGTGRARTLDLARAAAELHTATASTHDSDARGSSQLEFWRDQFLAGRLEPHPSLGWLFDWLTDHQPVPARTAVVHGDFRVGNVLYEGARIVGLLDWEMAHLGDPAEDLAWAYRALWSPERFVPLPEFLDAYYAAGGALISEFSLLWYRVFCEVKFATISLQAARSVIDGTSTNLRLADRARTVIPAIDLCLSWISQKELARC
jgi:aminoglycoside phosphotransferase (APT) family kinase protein